MRAPITRGMCGQLIDQTLGRRAGRAYRALARFDPWARQPRRSGRELDAALARAYRAERSRRIIEIRTTGGAL